MNRQELLHHGCALLREGAKHSVYVNLADTRRTATVPRHRELVDLLARKICRQLGVPER